MSVDILIDDATLFTGCLSMTLSKNDCFKFIIKVRAARTIKPLFAHRDHSKHLPFLFSLAADSQTWGTGEFRF